MKYIFLAVIAAFLVMSSSFAQAQEQTENTIFQYILVVTHKSKDIVYVNQDADDREFKFDSMICNSDIETKADPTTAGQSLGTLILNCKHLGFPIQTSVTCSLTDDAAQNHFTFGEGDKKFSFDLLCKARAR